MKQTLEIALLFNILSVFFGAAGFMRAFAVTQSITLFGLIAFFLEKYFP